MADLDLRAALKPWMRCANAPVLVPAAAVGGSAVEPWVIDRCLY